MTDGSTSDPKDLILPTKREQVIHKLEGLKAQALEEKLQKELAEKQKQQEKESERIDREFIPLFQKLSDEYLGVSDAQLATFNECELSEVASLLAEKIKQQLMWRVGLTVILSLATTIGLFAVMGGLSWLPSIFFGSLMFIIPAFIGCHFLDCCPACGSIPTYHSHYLSLQKVRGDKFFPYQLWHKELSVDKVNRCPCTTCESKRVYSRTVASEENPR